ncbi:MAG: YcgL domain-containing protein [Gammaproteobacteria bacterium]|nr:YcgL domain-containing protein [Gammaproteobacteria bacterium]
MKCFIYKSLKKPDTYLYLSEKDNFSSLPDILVKALGTLKWVMDLELSPEKKLAQADARTVISTLTSQHYYLQLPPQNLNNPL